MRRLILINPFPPFANPYPKMTNVIKNHRHTPTQQAQGIATCNIHIEHKSYKMAIIVISHTIGDPWAVMIHLEYTTSTIAAMM